MPDRHLVRKTYKRDRTGQRDRVVPTKLQAYIRADQAVWLAAECAKRSDATRGRYSPASELVREALDLLIEYTVHKEFLRTKAAAKRSAGKSARQYGDDVPPDMPPDTPRPAAPAGAPDARSQAPGAPGQPSSGNSEPV